MATKEMLLKIFGAFENDKEMALIMFAVGPLYSDGSYDANKGLAGVMNTVYRARVHSE
jgi:hypothetical protein